MFVHRHLSVNKYISQASKSISKTKFHARQWTGDVIQQLRRLKGIASWLKKAKSDYLNYLADTSPRLIKTNNRLCHQSSTLILA